MVKKPLFRAILLALALAGGGGLLAQATPAAAGTEKSFERGFDRGTDIRTLRARDSERLRERWRSQARERAAINANRPPVYVHPPRPSDRLSDKLWRQYPPLGSVTPRFDTNADVTRRVVTPPRDRIVPKGQRAFERAFLERRDR